MDAKKLWARCVSYGRQRRLNRETAEDFAQFVAEEIAKKPERIKAKIEWLFADFARKEIIKDAPQ